MQLALKNYVFSFVFCILNEFQNPAWCVNTNQYYVDLCNEIEGVSDVVKISMSQLQCWSPGEWFDLFGFSVTLKKN